MKRKKFLLPATIMLFLVYLSTQIFSAGDSVISQRLREAKNIQIQTGKALLPEGPESGLVLFADFEEEGKVYLGNTFIDLPFEISHYLKGRFGQGYYFEKPRANMLPAEMADIEGNISGFKGTGDAGLRTLPSETDFGKRVLAVTLKGKDAGFQTVPVPVSYYRRSWHEKKWTLLASCYVKGPKDTEIVADVSFVEKELVIPEPKKKDEKKEERIPDESFPQKITLTGDWQRVAAYAVSDIRLKERDASFSIKTSSPAEGVLMVDGLQFEQAGYYPHGHLMPTTWLPGGTQSPATFVSLKDQMKSIFPVNEGSVAFWTKTPLSSNLKSPGGIAWFSYGSGWNPNWGMSTYRFYTASEGFIYFNRTNAADGNWHHIVMGWDKTKGYSYIDGKLYGEFERKEVKDISGIIETYRLLIGGSVSDGQAANSIMDEFAIFNRRLTDEEILQLAEGRQIKPVVSPILFSILGRKVFFRDEEASCVEVKMVKTSSDGKKGSLSVDFSIGDVLFFTQEAKGEGESLRFHFKPGHLTAGSYLCRVGSVEEGRGGYFEFEIDIIPPLNGEHYIISSWGGGADTQDWRDFYKRVRFNALDTYSENLDLMAKNGFFYSWHYNFGNGIWSPENRKDVRETTLKGAEKRAGYPNWKYVLLNSEKAPWNLPDEKERKEWFDIWARKELGFPIPEGGWRFGTPHNPIQCWFTDENRPAEDGVYEISREFQFLYWWYNRGCGWWRLNAEAADVIKGVRSDVKTWTDPLRYWGQVAELDAGGTWSYQLTPEPLIGDFEESYSVVRGTGKEFYATLGMNYVKGLVNNITEPDGVKKMLVPTADDMIQQAWVSAVYIPSDALFYWSVDSLFHGIRREKGCYAEPDADKKLGDVLNNEILPIGTMLKGVPNSQRSIALLLPESTTWLNAGEGRWGWGIVHYANGWKRWLGAIDIPYDVLGENNITSGCLSNYKVIIFPMAQYVSKKVYAEVLSSARKGAKIIVDTYCKQEYPGMEKWEQEYYYNMASDKRKKYTFSNYGQPSVENLDRLKEELLPRLDVYAKGDEGPVIFNVRVAYFHPISGLFAYSLYASSKTRIISSGNLSSNSSNSFFEKIVPAGL